MIESARKHGPFDFRCPTARKIAAPAWDGPSDLGGKRGLEWCDFLARFFGNRQRHDFEALARYEAYRKVLAGSTQTGRGLASPVSAGRAGRVTAGGTTVRTPSPALAGWESEGGSFEHDPGRP
jgi:hypothetical protein